MAKINAPGEAPSADRVEKVARSSLGLEDDLDEAIPTFYTPLLTRFLTDNPGDTNFLVDREEGTGFGTVTCMEDQCWSDTILTADPDREGGGRTEGLGSLYEYALHCHNAEHIKCRDKRLAKQGIVIPPKVVTASAVMPQDIVRNVASGSSSASSSRSYTHPVPSGSRPPVDPYAGRPCHAPGARGDWGRYQSTPQAMHSGYPHYNDSLQRNHSTPLTPRKSVSSAYPDPPRKFSPQDKEKWLNSHIVTVDSDSDDEVRMVGFTPGNRTSGSLKSSGSAPAILSQQSLRSSQSDSKGISSPSYGRWQSGPVPAWTTKWATLTLSEKRKIADWEAAGVQREIAKNPELTIKRALMRRREWLINIRASPILPWSPPEPIVLRQLSDLDIHPLIRDTFERTDSKDGIMPPAAPAQPVAGPSTELGLRPLPRFDSGYSGILTGALQAIDATWQALSDRRSYLVQEILLLDRVITGATQGLYSPGIASMARSRRVDLASYVLRNIRPWYPPSALLLKSVPGYRTVTHPRLLPYLPDENAIFALRWEDERGSSADIENENDWEWSRPLEKDLQTFLQDSLNDFQEDIDVEAGLKKLKLSNVNEKLPGANFTMMPHQVLGVAFMVKREERDSGSRGGFLFDAMGLGKTVQCISLMLLRDERPEDFHRAPQLIVAPLALLVQWKSEIDTKTTKNWRVLIHHGSGRPKTAAALKNYDVVLTTYGTLMSESGLLTKAENKKNKKKRNENGEEVDDDDAKPISRRKGPLMQAKWFRVILDEGHLIRNKNTRTSKAVLALDVLHPWILTGTPVVNTLADLGPGLSFIGQMDLKDFHKRVTSLEKTKPKLAAQRSQAILKPLSMRRTKDTLLNGKKILDLPPKMTNLASLQFELEERAIYAALEQRARIRVNKFIERGTLMKNYSIVLQLLTRLRQCVNHPWLLRRKPGDMAREDDLVVEDDGQLGVDMADFREDDASEYGRAISLVGQGVVEAMHKKLKERYELLTSEKDDSEPQDMECAICYEPFDDTEIITPCAHIYCKGCMTSLFTEPMRNGSVLSDDQIQLGCRTCPMCREVIWPGKVFRASAIFQPPKDEKPEIDEAEEDPAIEGSDREGKKRSLPDDAEDFFSPQKKLDKGKGKAKEEPDAQSEDTTIPPSTKMRHLLELVQGYLAEDPRAKILVFSQFVEFLDLLRAFLKLNNIESIGYRGSMSQPQRDEAIRRFNTSAEFATPIPIMLISTKAGGVGLNLTMASKVIMCELAWNPATENQAVDRAHRIGQAHQVNVERLVIADSVEDRLLEIQERKGLLADGAMGEGDVGRLGRLTVDDIRRLFAIDRELE